MQSLVGNTEKLSGAVSVPGIAFQPQSPILFDQTIRSNIMFGLPEDVFDEKIFAECLSSSTLDLDMADPESTLHRKREETQCGQGGSELSGGQQARVALARCIYAALVGGECIILDDPIKALDPTTAARVWEKAIKTSLRGKTRVLVCNSQMLEKFASDKAVDRLIIMERDDDDSPGRITYNGPPSGLPQSAQDRLGDGYRIQEQEEFPDLQVFAEDEPNQPTAPQPEPEPEPQPEAEPEPEPAPEPQPEPEPQQQEEFKESVLRAVVSYCLRNGVWVVGGIVCTVLAQYAHVALFQWNEQLVKPLAFRKNYLIAVFLMLASQGTQLLKGVAEGFGGEVASRSIRLDLQAKLAVLGMPYLWAPENSTAQLSDLVTKDPQQFQQFAQLPFMLSRAGFSLAVVLFARPVITPLAVITLILYRYTRKPFGKMVILSRFVALSVSLIQKASPFQVGRSSR